tara:strand:- start:609 stop:863 length:255 start_codon:yes stop_codon:yes gene_type:complete
VATLIYIAMALSIFALGVCLGAIVENKRMTYRQIENRMKHIETTTQEIYVSLSREEAQRSNYTLVDNVPRDENLNTTREFEFNG